MIFNFLGCQEVDVLDKKLKDAKIQNTDFYSLRHDSMFISPPKQFEEEYISLIESISSWPTVSFNKILLLLLSEMSIAGWEWIHSAEFDIVILSWQLPLPPPPHPHLCATGIFHSAAEISW